MTYFSKIDQCFWTITTCFWAVILLKSILQEFSHHSTLLLLLFLDYGMSATTQFDLDLTQFHISLSLFYCRKYFEVVCELKAASAFRVFTIETGQFDEFHSMLLSVHTLLNVQPSWEGHKILRNLPPCLKIALYCQTKREIFSNFCGLLRISELYFKNS